MENTYKLAVGVCCCLKICNSALNMLVMGLVLGPSLMVISFTVIVLNVLPIIIYFEVCCCLHV